MVALVILNQTQETTDPQCQVDGAQSGSDVERGSSRTDEKRKVEASMSPTLDVKTDDEAKRVRRNRQIGTSSMMMLVLGFVGFAPAFWVGFAKGQWYYDALGRRNYSGSEVAKKIFGGRWDLLLWIHVFTTLAWIVLAVFQVSTGATGRPGSKRKTWHRLVGYIASSFCFLVTVQAVVLQCHKPFNMAYVPIMVNAAMICVNLFAGIRFARNKRFPEHKSAMAWTCAWTAVPGLMRGFGYICKFVSGAQNTLPFFPLCLFGISAMTLIAFCPNVVLVTEIKTALFLGNLSATACSCLIGAVMIPQYQQLG
jgi:uncharacterized membrane protein YozB (DUF420 family)